jgi:hypothetical protein
MDDQELGRMTYLSVHAENVEAHLQAGWLVALPARPHPVADAYARVPMVWLCDCPAAGRIARSAPRSPADASLGAGAWSTA